MVEHLWQLKFIKTSTQWARKHITESATGGTPSIHIFMFLPHVPLPKDLRARLHPIHIQHLGAPSPFSRDMSYGKAGIIYVKRWSILTATWRDQECFLRPQKPSSRTDPQYEVKARHVRYTSHDAFPRSVAQVYDSSNFSEFRKNERVSRTKARTYMIS